MLVLSEICPMFLTKGRLGMVLLSQRFHALEKAFSELHKGRLSVFILPAQGLLELLASCLVVAAQNRLELLTPHVVMPDGYAVQAMEFFTQSPPLFAD